MSGRIETLRQLGNFERYSVSRALIGFHPILVIGVTLLQKLPAQDATCRDILHQVVNELVVKERALSAIIVNENDRYPCFGHVQQEEFDSTKVVSIEHPIPSPTLSSAEERINNLIKRHINNPFDLGDKTTPLWRLVLERGNGKDDTVNEATDDILAIVISHIIGDGASSRRLLVHTLQLLDKHIDTYSDSLSSRSGTISSTALDNFRSKPMPASVEDLYPIRPGFRFLARIIYAEVIRPRLPRSFPEWIFGPRLLTHWQGNSVRPSAVFKSKFASKIVILPSLYSVAHSNPLAGGQKRVTVQSILQVLCQATVLKTCMKYPNKKFPQQENENGDGGLDLITETPNGLDPPAGVLVGNYVAGISRPVRCTSRARFWDEVLEYYNYVHCDPYQREIAIQRIGLLGHVPNGDMTGFLLSKYVEHPIESDANSSSTHDNNDNTTVEEMRISSSIELSNVGILERPNETNSSDNQNSTLLSKCTKPFFAQLAPGHACPIVASIISVNKLSDISVHIGWRDCVLNDEWIQYFTNLLLIGANKLVKSTETPDIGLTLDQLFTA